MTVNVTLAKYASTETGSDKAITGVSSLGLELAELNAENSKLYGYGSDEGGILVQNVTQGSKADEAGILTGDLIKEVNRRPVKNVRKLKKQLNKAGADASIQLLIKRGKQGFVVVKINP